jgi:hypothetical protein
MSAAPAGAGDDGTHADPEVRLARRRFSSALESNVLDYLHNAPAALEACVSTLERMFANVLDHPDDEKYRRVRRALKNSFVRRPKTRALVKRGGRATGARAAPSHYESTATRHASDTTTPTCNNQTTPPLQK